MSTQTASLPIERSYLGRAWMVVAAIVIAAATVVAFGLLRTSQQVSPAGSVGGRAPAIGTVKDFGPVEVSRQPIVINGKVCAQCR